MERSNSWLGLLSDAVFPFRQRPNYDKAASQTQLAGEHFGVATVCTRVHAPVGT